MRGDRAARRFERDEVDSKRVALVGYSLGAQAAALTAGVEDRLAAVILQAPPSHLDGADSSYDTVRSGTPRPRGCTSRARRTTRASPRATSRR